MPRRLLLAVMFVAGCSTPAAEEIERRGDEIVVCGRLFHTGAPVVLWTDPGGYDAYRVERRFAPAEESSWEKTSKVERAPKTPNRYDLRREGLSPEELERVRGGGWDLPLLQRVVDQFVIHYDVCGTSRQCFKILHDIRGLSVHFLLDIDGTIYQTMDLKERGWHATISNARSVGIEIANIGAYGANEKDPLGEWYAKDETGRMRVTLPKWMGDGGVRTAGFVARPARDEVVVGETQGRQLRQYDFTEEQYESLVKLTAALCGVFPKMACDYPRDGEGKLVPRKLSDEAWKAFQGVLGHFHVQLDKSDPGPAFQWERVIQGARKRLER